MSNPNEATLLSKYASEVFAGLVALAVSVVSHLLKGLDYEEATLAGGLMLMLWLMRAHFHADSDRPSIRQDLRALAGATLFTLAYGWRVSMCSTAITASTSGLGTRCGRRSSCSRSSTIPV